MATKYFYQKPGKNQELLYLLIWKQYIHYQLIMVWYVLFLQIQSGIPPIPTKITDTHKSDNYEFVTTYDSSCIFSL